MKFAKSISILALSIATVTASNKLLRRHLDDSGGNIDDEGFSNDPEKCKNIAELACNGDFKELCNHLSKGSADLGKELSSGTWTVFFPTDQAFRDIEDNVLEEFNKKKINRILMFHVHEGTALEFDDLTCTEKIMMHDGKYSRTTCVYNTNEDKIYLKHQNGSGNNKMGNNPGIIQSNLPACNGIIHIVDTLMLPFKLDMIGDDEEGGDPGSGINPTIGNDDMGGDPGFSVDPIENNDTGGDPGFGIGTIEGCCTDKGGTYRPSENADGSVSQWCDYDGQLYEGIYFWSVNCEGINDDKCLDDGDDGKSEMKCLGCCSDHAANRSKKCEIDFSSDTTPSTDFNVAKKRCGRNNDRAYMICGTGCIVQCENNCNDEYKQCMQICATINDEEGETCRTNCIQDASKCYQDCDEVVLNYKEISTPIILPSH